MSPLAETLDFSGKCERKIPEESMTLQGHVSQKYYWVQDNPWQIGKWRDKCYMRDYVTNSLLETNNSWMGERAPYLWAAAVLPEVRFISTHQLVQSQGVQCPAMASTDHIHKIKDIHAGKIVIQLWLQTIKQKPKPATLQKCAILFPRKVTHLFGEPEEGVWEACNTHWQNRDSLGFRETQQRAPECSRKKQKDGSRCACVQLREEPLCRLV